MSSFMHWLEITHKNETCIFHFLRMIAHGTGCLRCIWTPCIRLQENFTLSLSVCYLWNVIPKECSTHTHTGWFIWYEVHVYGDLCPLEPGRRAPAHGGRDCRSGRRWTWPQSPRLLVALRQETWRGGGVQFSSLFIPFDGCSGQQRR
jgi:hypothetical protein